MKIDTSSIRKVLVVTLSNLGDVVLTLPVFQALLEKFPGVELHALVGKSGHVVFQNDPRVKKLYIYDRRVSWTQKWKLVREIRAERYGLIVDLRHSFFGLFGGARHRTSILNFSKKTKHRSAQHFQVLQSVVDVSFPDKPFLKPARIGADAKIIVAAVGSKSDIKKWPPEYYAKLLDRLIQEQGAEVVLVGDAGDSADSARVREAMRSSVIDRTGKTDFLELVDCIARSALVITNDSAPLHIADHLGVPVLSIFGPTDPRKYGPRSSGSMAVRRPLFCAPCERAQCRFGHECMNELGVDPVYARALQLLSDEHVPRNLKVLVSRLDRIGDCVLTLPAIAAIRARFPNAVISVMTRASTAPLFDGHPAVDEVIPYFYEKNGRHRFLGNLRFLNEIVQRKFDIAFLLHPSHRAYLVPYLAGIPYRIGFDCDWSFLLTKKVPDKRSEGRRHESECTLDIVRAFGMEPKEKRDPELPLYFEDRAATEQRFGAAPRIAIHAGASCTSKRWPKQRFAQLASKILAWRPELQIAVVGGEEEKDLGAYLASEIGKSALDLTGRLSLKELAAFLSACELLVSNDSGPVHIAAAVGTKTLTIFGRNQAGLSLRRWRALGRGHRAIQKDVGCVVCLAHRCTIDFECLKAVSVEEVFEELKTMLSASTVQLR